MRWQLLCLAVLLCGTASSWAVAPSVERLLPPAGQRGTTFTLMLEGARLSDPLNLLLTHSGVTCTKLVAKSENLVEATLQASPSAPLGEHTLQLITKGGASEVRTFQVTPFALLNEVEPNDQPRQAQRVKLNTTILGLADSADSDHFTVSLKAGQRLSAEVVGVRLAAELTDTTLSLIGPAGEVLLKVDDHPLFRQDPFLSFVAPRDGDYRLLVHHSTFNGSSNHAYLLHIGSFPRPQAIFPLGGLAGSKLDLQFLGDEASGRGETLTLPEGNTPYQYFPRDGQGTAPTAHPIRVSPFPNRTEVEPNNELHEAGAAAAWPVAFNGIINQPGDVDHFRFKGHKGEIVEFNSYAYRLGTPVDTVLSVWTPSGELLGQNDDDGTHDSRLTVTLPADGEYFVRVADKRKQGGPLFVYRVELTQPRPDFKLFLAERSRKSQSGKSLTIPRGNRIVAHLAVNRDGVEGPVNVEFLGLPEGVTARVGSIPANEYFIPITLEAKPDALLGGKLVTCKGTAQLGDQSLSAGFVQELTLVRGPGDSALHSISLNQLCITVVEESPVQLKLLTPTVPLVPDSTLSLRYSLERKPGFEGGFQLEFPVLPPGVEVPTPLVIAPGQSSGIVTLVASPEADIGEWAIVAELTAARSSRSERDPLMVGNNGLGTTPPGASRRPSARPIEIVPVSSNLVTLPTKVPPVLGQFKPGIGEQGKTIQVICEVNLSETKLPRMEAKLLGLPPRSSASPVTVTHDMKSIQFQVKLDSTTPVGEIQSLVCELSGVIDDQTVVYRVGRGGKLRVVPPGELRTNSRGQPLSPLDVLRQQEKKQP